MATATQTMAKPARQRATTLAHLARDVETRATTMSAFALALAPSTIKAPGKRTASDDLFARVGNEHGREEAFRAALDHYIIEYRKHHVAAACDAGQTRFAVFRRLAKLFRRWISVRTNGAPANKTADA